MTNYNKFQNTYKLTPHSPLIHFQWDSDYATLRATEVKPKLDRYIVKHCREIPKQWKKDNINGKISLNYKMRIVTDENNKPIDLGRNTPYDIFYGNMGENTPIKKGVMNKSTLTITCFHADLLKYIDEIIGDFFIVTNFGTMQSKGFGSFTVDGKENSINHIYDVLRKEYTSGGYCYCFKPKDKNLIFNQIKMVYSLIKSGHNLSRDGKYPRNNIVNEKDYSSLYYHRSLLYQYVRIMEKNDKAVNMGNEKAWMKQKGIVPKLNASGYYVEQNDNYSRYVRALLGIGERIEYLKEKPAKGKKIKKETVTITEQPEGKDEKEKKAKKIERLNSPILFKVINDRVYFVGCEPNENIYGKRFSFASSMKRRGMTLCVPQKGELSDNFMNEFMEYCAKELNKYFKEVREYFDALKLYNSNEYLNLSKYEQDFRNTANITILRGKIKSE